MSYTTEEPGDQEKIARANIRRARRIAITFGVISGICLISIVYAYVQHGITQENINETNQANRKLSEIRLELDKCAQEKMQLKKSLDSISLVLSKESNKKIKK
ncbi:MAG: hypothetical protein JSS79_00600 [Bacteroidetes bacterium]|nr:hypothetical protein [Bacteroidota bacterium]